MNTNHLRYMERGAYYTVNFSSSEIPHAIQIDLVHDGGGYPYVVAPRGDILSATWSDDGTNLRVILIPSGSSTLQDIKHFKFYVPAGNNGLTNLALDAVSAYDINGQGLVNPVTVNITETAR
jgi:hypothetical protein